MHPVPDHVDDALALLLHQFQDKARIRSVLGALATQVQTLEEVLWDLHVERRLARATGAQLDGIGRLVGLPRGRLSEESYRTNLRAQIRLLRSHGTPEDLVSVVAIVAGLDSTVEIDEYQPTSVVVRVWGALDDAALDDIIALVGKAKPAGVCGYVESGVATGGFTFDSDDESEGLGDVDNPDVGGVLAAAQRVP